MNEYRQGMQAAYTQLKIYCETRRENYLLLANTSITPPELKEKFMERALALIETIDAIDNVMSVF